MIHELKTHPEPFQAVADGRKPFEIRRADRPYAVGDTLLLREWIPGEIRYTGRDLHVSVTYMVHGGEWGIPEDLCVMGLSLDPARTQ